MMKYILSFLLLTLAPALSAQNRFMSIHMLDVQKDTAASLTLMPSADSVPNRIPDLLSPDLFIPRARLMGLSPWISAPLPRPVVELIPEYGFNGSIGFGQYTIQHPDKFFSTLEGFNSIDIPRLYITRQMMIGNALRLARNFYMVSGILYGAQLGVMGNNWGMGTREGFIWHPSAMVTIALWNQYFQSVSVYSPVVIAVSDNDGAAVRMPATSEVFSFGVQASFVVGEFIIEVGTSVTPKPFDPGKSRYR